MEEDNPFLKSQTVDPEVRAYVYSLVNAVSFANECQVSDTDVRFSSVVPAPTKMGTTCSETTHWHACETSNDG